ncbi:hypothetical protein EDB86DRAFT_2804872 [Lactarius hatsudake]|nr:hypothetical protein EDB86DRAFT_2804872 [Lactarius hatsudake]
MSEEDGSYICDICHQCIRVGDGGNKNFLQHRGSPGCRRAAKKTASKAREASKKTVQITSFFSRVTTSVPTPTTSTTGFVAHAPPNPSPLIHLPTSDLPPQPGNQVTLSENGQTSTRPDAHATALLDSLDHAARDLPSHILEADESDDTARVISGSGPDDPADAWEFLDHKLNGLVGYGIGVDKVAQRVRRGPLGVEGLAGYIRGFVVDYGITGDLLEGKIGVLLKAIDLVKQPPNGHLSPMESHMSSPSLAQLSVNTSEDDDGIEYVGGLPSSSSCQRPSPLLPQLPVSPDIEYLGASKKAKCTQHIMSVKPGQTAIGTYPFLLHIEEHTPWEFSSHHGSLLLRARKCEDQDLNQDGLCRPCQALLSNDKFMKVLARAQDGVQDHTPYKYHGLTSLAEIAHKKEHTIEIFRLRRINDTKKLVQREGVISLHHQVLLAMSTEKVPRLDRVLRVASERNMSVAAILELLRKAALGIYRPRNFDEEEDLQMLLFLRLGGQRVAEIAHRIFGLPAPNTVRRRTMIPPLLCSPTYPLEAELVHNLKAVFDSLLPSLAGHPVVHAVFMVDEIAQEKRPRWCDRTNKILGWCREHTKRRCMDFNSVADAELLFHDMVRGDVHLAHEATVGAIGLLCNNSKLYCARPFLISGSCKRECAEDHAVLLQTALDAINHLRPHTHVRVVSIASDGEARRGKALVQLTFKHALSPNSPIYPWLSSCALLDLHVGDDDLICDKDYKHTAAKRVRNALLREKGIFVYGTWITPAVLHTHLLDAGHKSDHVRAALNPNDKQDVALAYSLLRDIWSLPALTGGPPGRIQAREALRLLGSLCYHLLVPYICVDMGIEDQLEHLSYAGHLALVLYVHDNACGDFLPTALYIDIVLMIKNVFFCVAKAKVDTPNADFNIVLLGTDRLEGLFGCLRTIIGNDANVDNYQLGSRLTGTIEAANILALHPEWDKAPRRLHLPSLTRDMSTIPDCADHITPRSWRASQSLHSVTPPTVWIQGRRKLEADHPFASKVLSSIESIPNSTMLAPFGTLLIHVALPTGDTEELPQNNGLHGLAPEAVTPEDADIPLTGDGMCRLEDAAVDLEWSVDGHAFSKVVSIDSGGTTVNKSRALALLFKHSKAPSSADRLRRVQQQARFVTSESNSLVDYHTDEHGDVLLVNNPVASLLLCEDKMFLCVGEVIGIHIGTNAVDHVSLDILLEDSVKVTYQAYSLVCTTPDDDSTHVNDWRTRELLPMKFKVLGFLIQPINPILVTPPSHMPYYLFDTATLLALTSSLRDRMTKHYVKLMPRTSQTHRYPYRETSGKACFVAETLYKIRDMSMHECPGCPQTVHLDKSNGQRVLAHIGSHVLHDMSIDRSLEPCGLCLRPATLCTIYLTRRSARNGHWTPRYSGTVPCPNATSFSYAAAMVSSESSPCSNVPILCSYCPDGSPAVWRYNMQSHLQNRHRGVDPDKHRDLWVLTREEVTAMADIWKHHLKQPKRRCKGKQKLPLKLSEAHSSRNASK